jgi:hypothetical protein
VLAAGATRFEVNRVYGHEDVWAVKGPMEFNVASFHSDSAAGAALWESLQDSTAQPIHLSVDGTEYHLGVQVFHPFGGGGVPGQHPAPPGLTLKAIGLLDPPMPFKVREPRRRTSEWKRRSPQLKRICLSKLATMPQEPPKRATRVRRK